MSLLAGVLTVSVVEAPAGASTTTTPVALTATAATFSTQGGTPTAITATSEPAFKATETPTTGSIVTGVVATLSKNESNTGSKETIIISQAPGTKATGSVTTAGQVSIGVTVDYELRITAPLTYHCVTQAPVHVVLSSTTAYTKTAKTVTVGNDTITVPYFSTTTCSLAAGTIDKRFAGKGGELSFTFQGTLTVPPPAKPSTLLLSALPASPQLAGTPVTLTATVKATGATATKAKGAVTFRDGTTVLGTSSAKTGTASLTTATLPVGTDRLTAVFGGGGGYLGSTAPALTYTVAAKPTVTLAGLPKTVNGSSPTFHTFTLTITDPANGERFTTAFLEITLTGLKNVAETVDELQYKDSAGAWCTFSYTNGATVGKGYFAGVGSSCTKTYPASFSLTAGTALTVDLRTAFPATPTYTTTALYGTETITATLSTGACSSSTTCTAVAPLSGTAAPKSTATVTILPASPFASNSTLFNGRGAQTKIRKTFDVGLEAKVVPTGVTTFYLSPPTGKVSYVIEGKKTTPATKTVTVTAGVGTITTFSGSDGISTKHVFYNTANLPLGSYQLTGTYLPESYTGNTIYASSSYTHTFTVVTPPTGTPFTCGISGIATGTVRGYVTASGTAPAATLATSAKTVTVNGVSVTLVTDPAIGAIFYNTNTKATLGFSPAGSTTATAGKITFTDATATSTAVTGTWSGLSTAVPVTKGQTPGTTLATGVDNVFFGGGLSGFTCKPTTASVPAPVASTEIAGTTLSASPTGSATVGSPVTLTATVYPQPATGAAPSQVQFFDGTKSLGAALVSTTGASLGTATLTTATLAVGTHSLTATWTGTPGNSIPFNASAAVSYTVNPTPVTAPVVTTQPQSAGVKAGQTATFTAAASGTSPSIQWQVSSNGGKTWANVSGATSDTYSLTATKGDNANQYRAVFSNAAGTATTDAATLYVTATGYWLTASNGAVYAYGNLPFYGSAGGLALNKPIVGSAATPTGGGYWLVASDGGIFAYGAAQFYGSMGGKSLNAPIVGMAPTPTGKGYWEVASDGGIFAFGAAQFYGSMGGKPLNQPVVGMAATPTGKGYFEVASDGGIFAFGAATFHGSTGSMTLAKPITAMSATPTGNGYWLVASDGGIFAFGSANFYGAAVGGAGAGTATSPVVGMAATTDGGGYLEVEANGRVVQFGDAALAGTALTQTLSGASIVSVTS